MVVQSIGLVADLRNQNKNIGVLYIATGLVTEGDNNGGVFWWNPSSTATDDGVDVIQVTGTVTGRWVRITDNNNSVPSSRELTINGTTYDLSANRTWSVGTVTGTGTTNYISKFTGASSLGNSLVYDNGVNVMIGTTALHSSYSNSKFIVSGTSNTYLEVRSINNQSSIVLSKGLSDTSTTPSVELFNSSNFGIVMYRPGVVGSNYIIYYNSDSVSNRYLSFQTEGSDRLTLNQNGTVRLNTYTTNGFVKSSGGNGTLTIDTTTYQPLLTNPVTGTGTPNILPKWASSSSLTNSILDDDGVSASVALASGGAFNVKYLSAIKLALTGGTTFGSIDTPVGLDFLIRPDSIEKFRISSTGLLRLANYGAGAVTGTATYRLATDASGNIIEVSDGGGTVTSVDMTVPTGLTISGNPITSAGTLAVALASGYSIPLTASQANWNTAYNDSIVSAAVTGTSTKTLTLNQQDGGTVTASWSDLNTDAVTSVFGRTGAVVATEGDYTLTQLGDVTLTSPTNGQVLKYNGTTWVNNTDTDTGLTSVGLSMPSAFSVSNSPLTSNGTIAVTGAGSASQYVRGDGTLAAFPSVGGGGGGTVYYLNGNISQGSIGGTTMYQLSVNAQSGTSANFIRSTTGVIASFITDVNQPNQLTVPSGIWVFETYLSEAGGGAAHATVQAIVEKWNGTSITVIATGTAEEITNGNVKDLYQLGVSIPTGITLSATDRIVIQIQISNTAGKTVTLYTENGNISSVSTTFASGLASLNGLTTTSQYFATGTSGTDFGISSSSNTHTFNLPTASSSSRGLLSSADWTTFNNKQNALTNPVTGTGTTNYLPKWTSGSAIGNSIITDSGSIVTVGGVLTVSAANINLSNNYNLTGRNAANTLSLPLIGRNGSDRIDIDVDGYGTTIGGGGTIVLNPTGGNVGIGTSSPAYKLDVNRSSLGAIAQFITLDGTYNPRLLINGTAEGIQLFATYSSGAEALMFGTANTERMRLTSNLIIGSTSDNGNRLQVNGVADALSFLVPNGGYYKAIRSSGSLVIDLLGIESGTDNTRLLITGDFNIKNGSATTLMNMTALGVTTFSSDVTVSGVLKETVTTNRQTASYTLALTDRGKLVEMNVATANNLTVPLNSSIAFPIGTKIDLAQYGAGQTTVVATSGVTVRSAGGALKLTSQYSGATLVKIATDEWYLFGNITV